MSDGGYDTGRLVNGGKYFVSDRSISSTLEHLLSLGVGSPTEADVLAYFDDLTSSGRIIPDGIIATDAEAWWRRKAAAE